MILTTATDLIESKQPPNLPSGRLFDSRFSVLGHDEAIPGGFHPLTEFARRFGGNAAEAPIEMGERLKAHVVGHFGDSRPGTHQHTLRFLNAGTIHKVGERETSGPFEKLAEVEGADTHVPGHTFERHRLGQMRHDEEFCIAHGFWLVGGIGKEHSVGIVPELNCERFEDRDGGLVSFGLHHGDFMEVNPRTPDLSGRMVGVQESFRNGGEGLGRCWHQPHATCPHGRNRSLSHSYGHEGLDDSRDSRSRDGFLNGHSIGLHLQRQRQGGQRVESFLVLLKEFTFGEVLNETETGLVWICCFHEESIGLILTAHPMPQPTVRILGSATALLVLVHGKQV